MYIRQWVFRLQRQQYETPDCVFLTLTYDYDNLPFINGKPTLVKKHYQLFLKRLRKALPTRKIKYVLCGEYGDEKGRPHYHAILFGITKLDVDTINVAWSKGQIHLGSVTSHSIAYTFKYAVKGSVIPLGHGQVKPFIAMSQGLGETFAFEISYNQTTGIDKNGKKFIRYSKVRTIKQHFKEKLNSLLQMPYYVIPNGNGGTVKMSVPKFYLRAAGYDSTALGELYADVMAKKYEGMSEQMKEFVLNRQALQRKYAVLADVHNRKQSVINGKL